ncbi:hypothetical protein N9H60_04345, partial [Flavimaricola sp.]
MNVLSIDWMISNLGSFQNNSDYQGLGEKRVLVLGEISEASRNTFLKAGVAAIVQPDLDCAARNGSPLLSEAIGALKSVEAGSIDRLFLDLSHFSFADFHKKGLRFHAELRRVLRRSGAIFGIWVAGRSTRVFDVHNVFTLSSRGWLPTQDYLYDEILRDWTIRAMASPQAFETGLNRLILRVTPKKPTLLLICAKSMSGKTTLAREFVKINPGMH